MKGKEFIIKCIDELVNKFPNSKARYEGHELSNTHFIEVIPNEFYKLDEEYQKWEEEITFKFIDTFPDECICFISDDAIVGIENVDHEAQGEDYEATYFFDTNFYSHINIRMFNIDASKSLFSSYNLGFLNSNNLHLPASIGHTVNSITYSNIFESSSSIQNINKIPVSSFKGLRGNALNKESQSIHSTNSASIIKYAGENNFALAA